MSDMKKTGRERASRPRRRFTDEFKAGAVRLVLEEKRTIRDVARSLDIGYTALGQWVREEEARRGIVHEPPPPTVLDVDERTELEHLRKRVRELEMEKAILKKAAAFFAKESS